NGLCAIFCASSFKHIFQCFIVDLLCVSLVLCPALFLGLLSSDCISLALTLCLNSPLLFLLCSFGGFLCLLLLPKPGVFCFQLFTLSTRNSFLGLTIFSCLLICYALALCCRCLFRFNQIGR